MRRSSFSLSLLLVSMSVVVAPAVADKPQVDTRPALPSPPGPKAAAQCGLNYDLQDVELYDGSLGVSKAYVHTYEPSTVQLQWQSEIEIGAKLPGYSAGNISNKRWCTGTLISNDLVLTAGHCFASQDGSWKGTGFQTPYRKSTHSTREFAKPEVLATLQQVNFRYQIDPETGKPRTPVVFPIEQLVELGPNRPGQYDYAIVRLGKGIDGKLPGQLFTPAQTGARAASVNEMLAMIQHPDGLPKQIGVGHALYVDSNELYYDDIDTLGGSSGAGVRDAGGIVIAVHTNGGCTVRSGFNLGVPISAISVASDIL